MCIHEKYINPFTDYDFKAVRDGTIYREVLDDGNFPDANENSTEPSPLNIDEIFKEK